LHFKGGKIISRELTEEERAEADAAKNAKAKAPPAKGGAAPVQDQEAIERLKHEIEAKNERNEKMRQEWESLTDN
jgi:hypothetical protein